MPVIIVVERLGLEGKFEVSLATQKGAVQRRTSQSSHVQVAHHICVVLCGRRAKIKTQFLLQDFSEPLLFQILLIGNFTFSLFLTQFTTESFSGASWEAVLSWKHFR